jgi:hypothetical protein
MIGSALCGGLLSREAVNKGVEQLMQASVFSLEGWNVILGMGANLLISFFAGGFVYAAIFTPPTYYFVKKAVTAYRRKNEYGNSKRKTA